MSNDPRQNDFSELTTYLDEKISGVDKRFDEVDARFDKLFHVFATKEDLETAAGNLPTKEDFSVLLTSIDAYGKKADTYIQEMVILSHKVDRLEQWVLELADKLNVRLKACRQTRKTEDPREPLAAVFFHFVPCKPSEDCLPLMPSRLFLSGVSPNAPSGLEISSSAQQRRVCASLSPFLAALVQGYSKAISETPQLRRPGD